MDESSASDDTEGEFYRIMAAHQDDVNEIELRLRKDMFDASRGAQAGIAADGNVVVMMVMNQATAKMMHDAIEAIADHTCEAGVETLMEYMSHEYALLKMLLPHLDADVRATQFFTHGA